MAVIGSVGCKTEVAPQAVVDPTPNPAPVYGNDPGPGPDSYPAYASRPYVRTVNPPPVVAPPVAVAEQYNEPYRDRHYVRESGPRRRVVTRERPTSHSGAIVGGGAGAGAAIGALAGGGKGAGIGALAGGAGGFIYDRLTHKRKVVVEDQR